MKKIIACNWKQAYVHSQLTRMSHIKTINCDVSIAVPFVYLQTAKKMLPTSIRLGAQSCSKYEEGPYTGEVSCSILKQIGCDYVIIGHSERRLHFNETNEEIKIKIDLAIKNNLEVILCVGETFEEKEQNKELETVKKQLEVIKEHKNIVVAYEPVWAIGTGKVATNDDIEKMIRYIKDIKNGSSTQKVLYGGSVSAKNIDLLNQIQICDGYLVGGASLTDDIFKIIERSGN